jgi:hypothetical protein
MQNAWRNDEGHRLNRQHGAAPREMHIQGLLSCGCIGKQKAGAGHVTPPLYVCRMVCGVLMMERRGNWLAVHN